MTETTRVFIRKVYLFFVNDGKTTDAGGPAGMVLEVDRKIIDSHTMELVWEKAEDTTEYIILKRDKSGNYNRIGRTKKCSFTFENMEKDCVYEIIIKTVLKRNGGISYGTGAEVCLQGTPTREKGLTFEKINISGTSASVSLEWQHIGEDATIWLAKIFDFYQIYQLKDGKWTKVGTTENYDYPQFTVKGLKPGKTYSFKVRAVSNGNDFSKNAYGKFSDVIKVTVPENIGKVKNVKKSLSGTTLKLSWDKVKGADKYAVFEYNAKKDEWVKVATVKGISATLKNISKGKTHQYKVRAYDKAEIERERSIAYTGAFSNAVKVKT